PWRRSCRRRARGRARSPEVLDVLDDVVRLGTDDDLHRGALLDDPEGTGGAQRGLVDLARVLHLDADPGDARLEVDDVPVATESREDGLCLAHCVLLIHGRGRMSMTDAPCVGA